MHSEQAIHNLSSSTACSGCERQRALRRMKRVLREGALDARAALLLSSSVIELEQDPAIDPRVMVALNRSTLLANA